MDLSGLSSNLPSTKPSTIEELNKELTNEFKNAAKSVAALYNSTNTSTSTTAPSTTNSGPTGLNLAPDSPSASVPASSAKKEFANAAKSVTALYRLTNNALSLARHRGYLDCLDDLLQVLTDDQDLENWVLAKRAELLNSKQVLAQAQAQAQAQTPVLTPVLAATAALDAGTPDFSIPLDYDFSMSLDISPHYHFRPSMPPLTVLYSAKQRSSLFKLKRDRQMAKKLQKHNTLHSQSLEDLASSDEDSDETEEDQKEDQMKLTNNIKRRKLDREKKA